MLQRRNEMLRRLRHVLLLLLLLLWVCHIKLALPLLLLHHLVLRKRRLF